jgi:hypothetical protein
MQLLPLLSERAEKAVRHETTSDSMVLNLRKWLEVMDSYLAGKVGTLRSPLTLFCSLYTVQLMTHPAQCGNQSDTPGSECNPARRRVQLLHHHAHGLPQVELHSLTPGCQLVTWRPHWLSSMMEPCRVLTAK